LELGYRRLSVASATEIERERRHHSIKIMRQLNTLNAAVKSIQITNGNKLNQIKDIQHIMSSNKLKSFFSVFAQTMAQSIIDIELTFNNLNSDLPPIDGGKVNGLCNSLYGIECIVEKIDGNDMELNDKLTKCVKWLKKIKNAITTQRDKDNNEKTKKVKTLDVNNVVFIVGRKLCLHCMQEIESNEIEQIPTFAEAKTTEIFKHILNGGPNKIFIKDPISEFDAAQQILSAVYGINVDQMTM